MKPPRFRYLKADSAAAAAAALAEAGEDARVLAGGQSLVPLMNFRLAQPSHLIDICGVAELDYVKDVDGAIAIGAATRQATVESDPLVRAQLPLLVEALELVAHPPIRHRGTVCGSIAHADPASELAAVAVALGAEMTLLATSGERTVPAGEFFQGPYMTPIGPGELLREVRFPKPAGSSAIVELSRTHGNFAVAGAVATLELDGDATIVDAALCVFGAPSHPVRATAAEERLRGEQPSEELLAEAASLAYDGVTCTSDIHGSAPYRQRVGGVYARRALTTALNRSKEA